MSHKIPPTSPSLYDQAFLQLASRAYSVDPIRTENELLDMKRDDVLAYVKVDAQVGRLRLSHEAQLALGHQEQDPS